MWRNKCPMWGTCSQCDQHVPKSWGMGGQCDQHVSNVKNLLPIIGSRICAQSENLVPNVEYTMWATCAQCWRTNMKNMCPILGEQVSKVWEHVPNVTKHVGQVGEHVSNVTPKGEEKCAQPGEHKSNEEEHDLGMCAQYGGTRALLSQGAPGLRGVCLPSPRTFQGFQCCCCCCCFALLRRSAANSAEVFITSS